MNFKRVLGIFGLAVFLLVTMAISSSPSTEAQTGSNYYTFTRDLSFNLKSEGEDVRILQIFLNNRGFILSTSGAGSPGNETTFFGKRTEDALARYQGANAIYPDVGYFGPLTRAHVNAVIAVSGIVPGGTTTPPPTDDGTTTTPPPDDSGTTTPPPTDGGTTTTPPSTDGGITTTDGTTTTVTTYTYQFNENLTIDSVPGEEIKMLQRYLNSRNFFVATSGPGSPGNETIFFGPATYSALSSFQASRGIGPRSQQGNFGPQTRRVVNPDILANGLTYTVIGTPPDDGGGTPLPPTPNPAPTVSLSASPSSITSGSSVTLTWSSTNTTSCTASGAWSGSKATSGSQSFTLTDASSSYYLITCQGEGGSDSDSVTVTVTDTPPTTPAPTVSLSASPSSISSGSSSTLSWSSTNATSCTASGAWSGSKATSGSQSVSPTSSSGYTLTCTGAGGSSASNASVTVTTAPTTPAPTVTLSAIPSSLSGPGSTSLIWTSTNATSCTASGDWSGNKATFGSQTLSVSSSSTYTLTCQGAGGSSASNASVTVNAVQTPTPTVSLSASPSSISSGSSSTLSWSSTNTTSCSASGAWSGFKNTSGTQPVSPSSSSVYTLTCTGAGGIASANTSVSVTSTPLPPPPAISNTLRLYEFEDSSTNGQVLDSSNNDAHGFISGSSVPSRTTDEAIGNYSYSFDGNDHVNIGDFDIYGNKMSISAWIKPTAFPASKNTQIVSKAIGGTTPNNHQWMLGTRGASNGTALAFGVKSSGVTTMLVPSSNSSMLLDLNTWTHVAATYDGSTMKLYKNGVLIGSTNKFGDINLAPFPVYIGNQPVSLDQGWQGNLDHVGIYSKALSTTEINALVAAGPDTNTPTPPTAPTPTATISASPSSITSGQSVTLSWSSTNATSCWASGDWSGSKATSGSQSVSPTSPSSYALICEGAGGEGLANVNVNVTTAETPAPTVSLSAIPSTLTGPGTTSLIWTSTNATSCTASNTAGSTVWSGTKATFGSQTVTVSSSSSYTLTCTGAGGSSASNASVTVNAVQTPTPTVSLSASPSSISSGSSATLTWSSTNATSCTASGAWSGSKATSGSQSVSPTSSSGYTLTCTGAGGSDSANASVSVTSTPLPPPPTGSTRARMGTNLDDPSDWSNALVSTNLMWQGRDWISGTDSTPNDGRALQLDANGYPTSLASGQIARSVISTTSVRLPAGTYTVRWQGSGTVGIKDDYRNVPAQSSSSSPFTFTVPQTSGSMVLLAEIRSTTPGNHVRNLEILVPGATTSTWYPPFLKSLQGYDTLRFMDWAHVNNTSGYTSPTPANYFTLRPSNGRYIGASPAKMAQLASAVGANMWFNVHDQASPAAIRQAAEMIRDNLDSDLKVYVEWSNEIWNDPFWQSQRALSQGRIMFPNLDQYIARMRYQGAKSEEMFGIFENVLGDSRVLNVIAGQAVNIYTLQNIHPEAPSAEVIASAPYYEGRVPLNSGVSGAMATWNNYAAQRGLQHVTYEGGQHYVNSVTGNMSGGSCVSVCSEQEAVNYNRSEQAYNDYKTYFQHWENANNAVPNTDAGLFVHFSHIGHLSYVGNNGSWASFERFDNSNIGFNHPKFRAIRETMSRWGQNPMTGGF